MRVTYMKTPRLGGCGCDGKKLGSCGCGVAGTGCGVSAYSSGCGVNGYGQKSPRRYALAALGLGDIDLTSGVSFTNHDAYNDFMRGVTLRGSAGRWDGVSQSLIDSLNSALSKATGSTAVPVAEGWRDTLRGMVAEVQKYQPFGIWGRSESQDTQYKAAMVALKAAIGNATREINAAVSSDNRIAAEAAKAAEELRQKAEQAAIDQARIDAAAAEAARQAKAAAEAAAAAAAQQRAAADAAAAAGGGGGGSSGGGSGLPDAGGAGRSTAVAKSGLPLGVILPLGGAAVVAALLFLMPKKGGGGAPAVAGYRSRRRRRRR